MSEIYGLDRLVVIGRFAMAEIHGLDRLVVIGPKIAYTMSMIEPIYIYIYI